MVGPVWGSGGDPGRFGGTWWCLEDVGFLADRLRAVVPGGATVSIGVAAWDGQESADELVARADSALYAAKEGGRDRYVIA
jgi:GGDEF domain-containing protein